MRSILLLILAFEAFALPRFSAREGVSCVTCHVYPGGGAARNSYGREYVLESLSSKDQGGLQRIPVELSESLTLGLDARLQSVSYPEDEQLQYQDR